MAEPEEPNLNPGPFSIGSDHYAGTSKLLEEMGELQQALGKLIALGHMGQHWDGSNLQERIEDEIADVKAALWFFIEKNGLNNTKIGDRAEVKLRLFEEWHGHRRG